MARVKAWRVLVDPSVPVQVAAEDAVQKGLLGARAAQAWIEADRWVSANMDALAKQFPGQVVAVTFDEKQAKPVSTYVGKSYSAALQLVSQFDPLPFVLISDLPADDTGARLLQEEEPGATLGELALQGGEGTEGTVTIGPSRTGISPSARWKRQSAT